MDVSENSFLWVEKYRPQKIDDCVLPQALKDTFRQYVEQGELPNFLFTGSFNKTIKAWNSLFICLLKL